jgi:hypothetical protein
MFHKQRQAIASAAQQRSQLLLGSAETQGSKRELLEVLRLLESSARRPTCREA